jgi:hypothetical protein
MIVLQSLWTGVAELPAINQKSATGMSSPGGEETGEGELNPRGRQSALISFRSVEGSVTPRPCPFGTFENSPALQGWVNDSTPIQSPAGTAEILSCRTALIEVGRAIILSKSLCLCASVAKNRVPWESVLDEKGRNCKTNPIFYASLCG